MANTEASTEIKVPRVLIGVPILAWTHEFATSFLSFWTDVMTFKHEGLKFHVGYKFVYHKPVHMAEEELAQLAVDSGCTHLLLMDDDIYDVKALDLIKLLKADKDVVGGIMYTSGFPYSMCAFRRYDRDTKVADQPILNGPLRLYEVPLEQRVGTQSVDLIPFGFTLFKTSIFNKLEKPWFKCNTQAPTDSWFADSIKDKHLDYYAHFGVWLNHRGITQLTRPYYYQMGVATSMAKASANMIRLTPEEMKRHELMMSLKMKEAEKKAKEAEISEMEFFEKNEGETIAVPLNRKTEVPKGNDTTKGEHNGI